MELECGNCGAIVKRSNATVARFTWVGDVWVCLPCNAAYTKHVEDMMWEDK